MKLILSTLRLLPCHHSWALLGVQRSDSSLSDPPGPTVDLWETIRQSSRAQRNLDLEHYIHWSRHLLVYIGNITGAQLLIGASAVTYIFTFNILSLQTA
jgi:hypothetical protein